MKRMMVILAVLGAVLSGWIPAMAATMTLGHAVPAAHHASGTDSGTDHGKPAKAVHMTACSACFAIEATRIDERNRPVIIAARVSFATAPLDGLTVPPADPPPRT